MSENLDVQIKPTYFEIFTKVLNELNWREVNDFDEITKSEHKRILNSINAVNTEVLSSYTWDFMIEKKDVNVKKNSDTILDNCSCRIISIYGAGKKYKYVRPEVFLGGRVNCTDIYSFAGDKIITKQAPFDRDLSVIYISDKYAQDASGNKKTKMEDKQDTSIIPLPHTEPVLVYGTLIKAKANPSFAKFGYWRTLYLSALANMRAASTKNVNSSPVITLG